MILAIVFGIIAAFGLLVAIVGHANHPISVAPSMSRNTLSFPGYLACIIAGIMSLAAYTDSQRQPTPDQLYGCTLQQQAPNGDCPCPTVTR